MLARAVGKKHSRILAQSLAAVATTPVGSDREWGRGRPCRRSFHATPQREILPLIGVVAVVMIGRYSYKALKRMDAEWEDYQWELQEYEKQQLKSNESASTARTIAIDLGTVHTKLASSYPKPEVITTREGDRYFFNGVVYDSTDVSARGRGAMEKYYFAASENSPPCPVSLPWTDMETNPKMVEDVLGPALDEMLDRMGYNDQDEETSSIPLRSIVVVPPSHLTKTSTYSKAFANVASSFLPDPVAAIWGAQWKGLLPTPNKDEASNAAIVVVDFGGYSMSLSLVQKDLVVSSISLPWGGERWIEVLVDILRKDREGLDDERSLSALQQQARLALTELSSKSRVDIHVPYLFPDPAQHHLDTSLSRGVLEQALQGDIQANLIPMAEQKSALSPHTPHPTDLSSLLLSSLTQLLEQGGTTPMAMEHVLLVGGAARAPIVALSLETALQTLMGPDGSRKLVVPDQTLLPELTALGASTMLPSFVYSMEAGLERHES